MKKVLTVILSLLLAITMFGFITLVAASTVEKGETFNNIKYSYDTTTKTLTFSGKGKLIRIGAEESADYIQAEEVYDQWHEKYKDKAKNVVIESGITEIGEYAFYGFTSLRSVSLPGGLTKIGGEAFKGCTALTSIIIPKTVNEIKWYAFEDCTALKAVTLGDGIRAYGDGVFSGCTALKTLYLYANTFVDETVFSNIESLETIHYSGKMNDWLTKNINGDNSARIGLLSGNAGIKCDDTVNETEYRCVINDTGISITGYRGAGAECLKIPDTLWNKKVNEITNKAFYNVSVVEKVFIPNSVTSLFANSFNDEVLIEANCNSKAAEFYAFYSKFTVTHNIIYAPFTPPTCTEPGNEGYMYCSNCDYCEDIITYMPLGHSFSSEYTIDYYNVDLQLFLESRHCLRCGAKLDIRIFQNTVKNSFKDVKTTDYYYGAVMVAAEKGVTTGTSKTSFSPNQFCTRAEIVTFIWRDKGCPEPKSSINNFRDINENDYFYKAVLWAVENGITSGTSSTKFSPSSRCTRGQAVTFIWRAEGCPEPSDSTNPFSDIKENDYFYKAVLWAVENGITKGMSASKFKPNSGCTRAQIVTFINRSDNREELNAVA